MNKMNRYALIAALAMFLSGCVAQREPAPVEEVKPVPDTVVEEIIDPRDTRRLLCDFAKLAEPLRRPQPSRLQMRP